jgi:hypothetical protein
MKLGSIFDFVRLKNQVLGVCKITKTDFLKPSPVVHFAQKPLWVILKPVEGYLTIWRYIDPQKASKRNTEHFRGIIDDYKHRTQ